MPPLKDYRKSLNKGLYNVFHARHVTALFDCIIKDVEDAAYLPKDETELEMWVMRMVKDILIFKQFKTNLVKYIIRAIKKAPLKEKEEKINYECALASQHSVCHSSKSIYEDSF